MRVIPLILRPCRFTRREQLSAFQALNLPDRPPAMLADAARDLYYRRVAAEIESLVARVT